MKQNRPTSSKKYSQGLAMVELTIALPVLILLMWTAMEVGHLLYTYNSLTKLTRSGARYLSSHAYTGTVPMIDLTDIKRLAVQNIVVYGNAQGNGMPLVDGLNIGMVTVQAADSAHVEVLTTFVYRPIFNVVLLSDLNLNAAVNMRVLN
jgi:Flp pilus assembly protein TadG